VIKPSPRRGDDDAENEVEAILVPEKKNQEREREEKK
jgi:hypothetical protein